MIYSVTVNFDTNVGDTPSQYCSRDYQKLFVMHGLVCSMSKRGDCFDNAAMESWNHSFKIEAIHREKLATRTLTKNVVFEYIEIYYSGLTSY